MSTERESECVIWGWWFAREMGGHWLGRRRAEGQGVCGRLGMNIVENVHREVTSGHVRQDSALSSSIFANTLSDDLDMDFPADSHRID